jgi:hypothetical protein
MHMVDKKEDHQTTQAMAYLLPCAFVATCVVRIRRDEISAQLRRQPIRLTLS